MDTQLSASVRDHSQGKGGARKARKSGGLPAVIYGPSHAPESVTVEPKALEEIFRHSQNRNTLVQLQLGGKSVPVLVREVQRHPVSRQILHVDFYRVDANHPVRVQVPVVATGKAKGLAGGGRVQIMRRALDVLVPYDQIPAAIEVDTTELDVADVIRVSAVVPPKGAKLLFDQDFPVVTVAGKVRDRAEEAPAAAAATPAKK